MSDQDLMNKLIDAAYQGEELDFEKLLLEINDINISYTGSNSHLTGMTLLHTASAKGNLALVQLLIENMAADLDCEIATTGMTALHYAALKNKTEIVSYLLDKGADRNALTITDDFCILNPLELAQKSFTDNTNENFHAVFECLTPAVHYSYESGKIAMRNGRRILEETGDFQLAAKEFKNAYYWHATAGVTDKMLTAAMLYGECLQNLGKYDTAIAWYKRIFEQRNKVGTIITRHRDLIKIAMATVDCLNQINEQKNISFNTQLKIQKHAEILLGSLEQYVANLVNIIEGENDLDIYRVLCGTYTELASLYQTLGQAQKADTCYSMALEKANILSEYHYDGLYIAGLILIKQSSLIDSSELLMQAQVKFHKLSHIKNDEDANDLNESIEDLSQFITAEKKRRLNNLPGRLFFSVKQERMTDVKVETVTPSQVTQARNSFP